MRKVDFIRFDTPALIEVALDAFERGGFFCQFPEQCAMRGGAFILRDPNRGTYVVVVCQNGNSDTIWQ